MVTSVIFKIGIYDVIINYFYHNDVIHVTVKIWRFYKSLANQSRVDCKQSLFFLLSSSSCGKTAKTGARNPGQGKTREARKIGTADNLLFKSEPPTFVAMSQSGHVQ